MAECYEVKFHVNHHQVGERMYKVFRLLGLEVRRGAELRNRYNQVPHLTQDTNGKVTNSKLNTTNESQEGSSFPAGDHKAHINRRAQRHSKHTTEKTQKIHKRSAALERSVNIILEGLNQCHRVNLTLMDDGNTAPIDIMGKSLKKSSLKPLGPQFIYLVCYNV